MTPLIIKTAKKLRITALMVACGISVMDDVTDRPCRQTMEPTTLPNIKLFSSDKENIRHSYSRHEGRKSLWNRNFDYQGAENKTAKNGGRLADKP